MLQLTIVTPFGEVFSGEADEVVAPGFQGEFGVLSQHLPFLTRSEPGVVKVMRGGTVKLFAVGQSFVEVSRDRVLVLSEAAFAPEDIDLAAARAELAAAEKRLAATDLNLDNPDVREARHDVALALVKLEAAGSLTLSVH